MSHGQARRDFLAGAGDGPIWESLGETAMGTRAKLLDHHTRQNKHGERHIIPSDDKHPPMSERKASWCVRPWQTPYATTPTPEAYEVLDVTGRIVGIGSLGAAYLVLIAGGGTPDTNRLLDVKEAVPCSVLKCTRVSQPDTGGNDAVRVVRRNVNCNRGRRPPWPRYSISTNGIIGCGR